MLLSVLLDDAGVDAHNINEIVYVCGTTCLPGLDDCICLSDGEFREEIETPFSHGTAVEGRMVIQQRFLLLDVLSRVRLCYLSAVEAELREAFSRETMIEDD